MKTVFDNDMLVHVWAQQNQEYGRNPKKSLWFRGHTLYSYSTPIAHFLEHEGKRACLITTNRYSVTTTGKHIPLIHNSLRGGGTVFRVPNIHTSAGFSPLGENLKWFKEEYEKACLAISRAKSNLDFKNQQTSQIRTKALSYAGFFGVEVKTEDFPSPNPDYLDVLKQKAAKVTAAKAKAAKERKAAKALALQTSIDAFLAGSGGLSWNFYADADESQKASVVPLLIREWREDKSHSLHYSISGGYGDPAMLRLKGDVIETSKGAEFPVKDAVKAFPIIVRMRAQGDNDIRFEGEDRVKLGNFAIDEVHANGDVKAGCHFVKWEEIEAMAKQLQLI